MLTLLGPELRNMSKSWHLLCVQLSQQLLCEPLTDLRQRPVHRMPDRELPLV